mmetsp:Transcript_1016/g.2459  ORF Transcript_1016/g.2459 Transcript_1016/m.2459 type:complete len:368 (-) Transcript_1016:373-1476(-)|eukprot:CAMPEP_0171590874 /NCGR_PEP_ID=MMETSP0961-20121227/15817_1 /TAXON_ID=87120 /ORGANISM="Aurantiochytrium limacinum, Strain ATCCMYA-1381" /LENGTH=367 /DNA_ID=CAMNT_0012150673 /DNA_START=128 /DNA_END=1231 /DNA_ORIENTATION=-
MATPTKALKRSKEDETPKETTSTSSSSNKQFLGSKTDLENEKATTSERPTKKKYTVREPLQHFSTPDDVIRTLQEAKHILVLAGAGISQSCGIPDFRSPAGIYTLVEEMDLGLPQAECLFDLSYFEDDPEPFYKFAHILYPDKNPLPSRTHQFLRQLEVSGKLGRVYTQNIDGLEAAAGVRRAIQCHGSLSKGRCLQCRRVYKAEVFAPAIRAKQVAYCPRPKCEGVLKPTVTFFGEAIDNKVEVQLATDAAKADLLLVMGTSLQVAPMSGVPGLVPPSVPQVLINRESVKLRANVSAGFDVELLGSCDDIIAELQSHLVMKNKSRSRTTETAHVKLQSVQHKFLSNDTRARAFTLQDVSDAVASQT